MELGISLFSWVGGAIAIEEAHIVIIVSIFIFDSFCPEHWPTQPLSSFLAGTGG